MIGISYWLLRHSDTREVLGIAIIDFNVVYSLNNAFDQINEAMRAELELNWENWDIEDITHVEFGTYQEFGFKEFNVS